MTCLRTGLLASVVAGVLLGAGGEACAGDWRDDLRLTGFAGAELAGETLRGQPLLVQFWESWCRSCGALMADLDELAARFPAVRYLVVSTDADPDDALRRLDAHPLFSEHPERFFHDGGRRLAGRFEVATVPTVLVIDAAGRERMRHSGHFDARELQRLVSALRELQPKPAGDNR